ncbi:hypothetical protein D9M71_753190 [compost metagenome]
MQDNTSMLRPIPNTQRQSTQRRLHSAATKGSAINCGSAANRVMGAVCTGR